MDNIFGSTLSLSGFLNDPIFCGADGEEFLNDLGGSYLSDDLDAITQPAKQTSSHSSSLSGSDTADNFPSTNSGPLYIPNDAVQQGWPTSGPMAGSMVAAAPVQPMRGVAQDGQPMDSAAMLSQLLSTIQANAQQPVKQESMRDIPATRSSQSAPSAGTFTLPSLTAQQQQALQAIMSLGSLGSTPEGKKVRRMLSNRESARRSRHRKQAHMHDLEAKVNGIESENESLKRSVAKFQEQEARYNSERSHLYAEIAALHSKVAQLEQARSGTASPVLVGPGVDSCASGLKRSQQEFVAFEANTSKRQAFCPV